MSQTTSATTVLSVLLISATFVGVGLISVEQLPEPRKQPAAVSATPSFNDVPAGYVWTCRTDAECAEEARCVWGIQHDGNPY